MANKVCKWCGREFDGDSRSSTSAGNWVVCSESCRHNLSASLATGDTKPSPILSSGCMGLIVLVILFFLIGYLTDGKFGSKSSSRQDAPTEQTIESEEASTEAATEDSAPTEIVAEEAATEETADEAPTEVVTEEAPTDRMEPAEVDAPAPSEEASGPAALSESETSVPPQ